MKKGIEYADKRWNPHTGCENITKGKCAVGKRCWAYAMSFRLRGRSGYDLANPFQPTFHPDRLDVPLKRLKPTRFATCFMGDIAYAKKEWLQQIIDVIKQCPQHTFYFLTKCPDDLGEMALIFPDNAWVGVTVNSQDDEWRLNSLEWIAAKHLWVSFEPLYGEILPKLKYVSWIVIGAQTNPVKQPEKKWVENIIECAEKYNIPVFLKPNLTVVAPRLELPEAIRKVA